jgi:hypothetical protein
MAISDGWHPATQSFMTAAFGFWYENSGTTLASVKAVLTILKAIACAWPKIAE